jgi:hypothetical protein
MNPTHRETPADLVFSPQTPFSWTRRWALAHRKDRAVVIRRGYRIVGSARTDIELTAVAAFCEAHGATLVLD